MKCIASFQLSSSIIAPFLCALCLINDIWAQTQPAIVHIGGSNQLSNLLTSIAPNRTIRLASGRYKLAEDKPLTIQHADWERIFDGSQWVIHGVSNLTLESEGHDRPLLLVDPAYATVITFRHCTNVALKNLSFAHDVEPGYCVGDVLLFENCQNVCIDGCDLSGSGAYGITGINVVNMTITHSVIRNCTFGILSLEKCHKIRFEDSLFRDNQECDLVRIWDCQAIWFQRCEFRNNRSMSWNFIDYYLFKVLDSDRIQIDGCHIEDNATDYLYLKGSVHFSKTVLKNNQWKKGKIARARRTKVDGQP